MSKVKISVLEKANGENCQISYISQIDHWVIASKNVSLLAKSRADLEKYKEKSVKSNDEENFEESKNKKNLEKKESMNFLKKNTGNLNKDLKKCEDRFQFAYLIGVTFFDILDSRQISTQNLKDDMKDITLVGEYCDPEHAHLVHYKNADIKFYAIVDHNSLNLCILPDLAFMFFQKHNLTTVKIKDLGEFENFNDFQQRIKILYGDVIQSPIEEEGEGNVLYFSSNENVLSLCKLKTLEYSIFRKLREKLKKQLNEKFKHDKKKEKLDQLKWRNLDDSEFEMDIFMKEFQLNFDDVCENFNPPKKREYYSQVAKKCFLEVLAKNFANLQDKYLQLLTNVRNTINSEEYKMEGDWRKIEEEKKGQENNKKENLGLEKEIIEQQSYFIKIQNQIEQKPEGSSETKNKKTMKYLNRDFFPTDKI